MALVDWTTVTERANADGEFRLHARFWNARIRVAVGDDHWRLDVVDGRFLEPRPWYGTIAGDLYIGADVEQWERLLERVPRPFYQDLYPATIHHGFRFNGGTGHACAYYPAVRRLVEIAREVRNGAA